ncbi:helix-turn-helix domain-containing protein [Saccharopolyspora hattusasensis]|uniref:helix-turn-helix domain-containing protein n=1 Tax=Saccharopolyspora hattusasensis TaxID=1128679 RepID=UPI003D96C59D
MSPTTSTSVPNSREAELALADAAVLGQLLRDARRDRGLSLKAFAAQSGISEGLLSKFERGSGNPSLLTLQKIAAALGIRLSDLFHQVPSAGHDGGEAEHSELRPDQCAVVRPDDRKRLVIPFEGLVYELLSPDLQRGLAMLYCEIPVGFEGSARPFQHKGEDTVHVLTGRFEVHVAHASHVLEPGDTVTFQSSLPHWWKNIGDVPATVICVNSPPSF